MTINSLANLRNLNDALSKQESSFNKLSSGKRITKAADDAAGLAVAKQLQAEAATLSVGSRNAGYSQSALDIAGGALNQISDISQRLGELAVQAGNGALSDAQRSSLNAEYQQLTQEVSRISETTQFNGKNLLKGDSLDTQVGNNGDASSIISTSGVDAQALAAGISSQDISTQGGAQAAITAVNSFVSSVASTQGNVGSSYSRLDSAIANNDVSAENRIAAASRIEDVDVAAEFAKKIGNDIRAQVGVAVNAQANQSAAIVQSLLK